MPKSSSITIGLTGGIASGKSAVSDKFQQLGCDIIDADIIAREVVQANTIGLKQLHQAFGKTILTNEGTLDRGSLRKLVFNNKSNLEKINSILHPLIRKSIIKQTNDSQNSIKIIVIPLLCESNDYKWLDRVLVVDVKPEIQLKRLLQRDNITQVLADKMINSQCSRNQRLSIANDVINNENTLKQLHKNVETLHRLYKSL